MPNTAPISWKCLLGSHLVLFKERRERETRRLVNAGGQSVAVSLENRSIHPAGTSSGELEQTALCVSAAHNKDEPPHCGALSKQLRLFARAMETAAELRLIFGSHLLQVLERPPPPLPDLAGGAPRSPLHARATTAAARTQSEANCRFESRT